MRTLHILLSFFLTSRILAAAPIPQTKELELENGIKIILQEDHRAPVVGMALGWKMAVSTKPGTGHLLSHFLGEGPAAAPLKALGKAAKGGIDMAATDEEMVFIGRMSRSLIGDYIRGDRERFRRPQIDSKALPEQIEIMGKERSQEFKDTPWFNEYQGLHSAAFTDPILQENAIPDRSSLEKIQKSELEKLFSESFVGARLTIAVVGDFESDKMEKLLKETWKDLPRGKSPAKINSNEQSHYAPFTSFSLPLFNKDRSSLVQGYRVPGESHPDYPALDLLSDLLTGDPDRTLLPALIGKGKPGLFSEANVTGGLRPHLLRIYVLGDTGIPKDLLFQTLRKELRRLREVGFPEKEIEHFKELAINRGLERAGNQERLAGELVKNSMNQGSYRAFYEEAEKFKKISAADLKRVLTTYIVDADFYTVFGVQDEKASIPGATTSGETQPAKQ